jgi:DNA helicase-2/ATP-dependent DNA helicase PcrA
MQLTDEQQAVVAHNHGPALVFAVAGAGKTTSMVARIERLVRERVFAAEKILATSFSRAAVADIQKALEQKPGCLAVKVRTLHSLGNMVLQQAVKVLGVPQPTQVSMDAYKKKELVLKAIALGIKEKALPEGLRLESEDVHHFVSMCKGNLRYPDQASFERLPPSAQEKASVMVALNPEQELFVKLYPFFERIREKENLITFDDMLLKGWEYLHRYPDLLGSLQEKYTCVLVDEFQDVNLVQSEILDMITARHRNYMAIGDDDQTIYEWRGASPHFILNFTERYDAREYLISDNFRFGAGQLVPANHLIAHNQERRSKQLSLTRGFPGRAHCGNTYLIRTETEAEMARRLVSEIQILASEAVPLPEMVILIRQYAQTPYLEQELLRAGIPYRVVGSSPFYTRPEVKNLLSYLRVGLFQAEMLAGQYPQGEAIAAFKQHFQKAWFTPNRFLKHELCEQLSNQVWEQKQSLVNLLYAASSSVQLHAGQKKGCLELAKLFGWLGTQIEQLPAHQILSELVQRIGYKHHLMSTSGLPEIGQDRCELIDILIDFAREQGTAREFLAYLETLSQQAFEQEDEDPDTGRLLIMTAFRAKGLEWNYVFVPYCNRGSYPVGQSTRHEEDRRIFYVAMTRARRNLYLYTSGEPSPFLEEAQLDQHRYNLVRLGKLFQREPNSWLIDDLLFLLAHKRAFGLERYIQLWWQPETAEWRPQLAQRLQGLLRSAPAAGETIPEAEAEQAFWEAIAPAPTDEDTQIWEQAWEYWKTQSRGEVLEPLLLPSGEPLQALLRRQLEDQHQARILAIEAHSPQSSQLRLELESGDSVVIDQRFLYLETLPQRE